MERVRLEDVCRSESSNLAQKDLENIDGEYPVYGASGYIKRINFYHQEKEYIAVIKDGAGVGRVMLLPAKSSVIGTLQYLVPKEGIVPKYLYYAVKSMKLCKYHTGATIPHIYFKNYKGESFPLPKYDKQMEVVSILENVEKIMNKRKIEVDELDTLIKSRFVEMFGDENNSKKWNIVNVEDVADVQVGVVIKPSQYYTDERNGIRAFRSQNIGDGYIKDNDWVYFTREGHEKNSKSILKENDLLIVRSGAPGTACVVTEEYVGCNAIDIIIAHPNCNMVNPYYFCTYTNMPHGKRQIEEGTGGAAQQHFNIGKCNKLQLMLPPMELQNEFGAFVHQVDKLKFEVQKSLDETQLLFDSLMQKYFG